MRMYKHLLVALLLMLASSMALAVPVAGSGGGYFGTAWFSGGQGIVVGPYSTSYACTQAFEDALDLRESWGWTAVEINPCSYTPPFASVNFEHALSFEVDGSDPGTSLEDAKRLLQRVRNLRQEYRIDEYENELRRIK